VELFFGRKKGTLNELGVGNIRKVCVMKMKKARGNIRTEATNTICKKKNPTI